jgi:membrane protease YdiL (CAAX protease family)
MLCYAFLYTRDTLSDLLVFSFLCLLLHFGGTKIGLVAPDISVWGKPEKGLIGISFLLIIFAWLYGLCTNKISLERSFIAINISLVYIYYAFVQHFLAQKYLTLRLYTLLQNCRICTSQKQTQRYTAVGSSLLFAALHITYPHLIPVAACGGFLYAYYYLQTGRLYSVVFSHALIASSNLYWILDDNPFTELLWLQKYII